jgi:hypothetical protein
MAYLKLGLPKLFRMIKGSYGLAHNMASTGSMAISLKSSRTIQNNRTVWVEFILQRCLRIDLVCFGLDAVNSWTGLIEEVKPLPR